MSHGYVRTKDIRDGAVTVDKLTIPLVSSQSYIVNPFGVDAPELHQFTTIANAIAWVCTNRPSTEASILELSPLIIDVQTHTWDGSGFPVDDDHTFTLHGDSNWTVLEINDAVCADASDVYPSLGFTNLKVVVNGDWHLGLNRQFSAIDCRFDGDSAGTIYVGDGFSYMRYCHFHHIQFDVEGVLKNGGLFEFCDIRLGADLTFFTNVFYLFQLYSCVVRMSEGSTLVNHVGYGTVPTILDYGTSYYISHNRASGTSTLFNLDQNGVVSTFGSKLSYTIPQAGGAIKILDGSAQMNIAPGPGSLEVIGDTAGLVEPLYGTIRVGAAAAVKATSVPAFDALVTVPTVIKTRTVYGSISLASTAGNTATVTVEVEDTVGAGTYTEVLRASAGAGPTVTNVVPYNFTVRQGLRYRFRNIGVGAASVTLYSYTDNP